MSLLVPSIVIAESVVLRDSYAGRLNYTLTGESLRTGADGCTELSSSSADISIPSGSTIEIAYLYWSGSGSPDTNVTFNGLSIASEVTYTEVINTPDVGNQTFFSARTDVTDLISTSASSSYTVGNLNFDESPFYCDNGSAYGGWSLLVVFEHPDEPLRVVNLYDGFQAFQNSEITLIPDNFVIAQNPAALGAKHGHITWEGDTGNSQALGFTEDLVFEGVELVDANNPAQNQFNSYSNTVGRSTSGVDIDAYEVGNLLTPGSTSVITTYSSGQDRVFLSAEIIAVPNEEVSDLAVDINTNTNNIIQGDTFNATVSVINNGPNASGDIVEVSIPLTDGLVIDQIFGANWNCSIDTNSATCRYDNILADGESSPLINIVFDSSSSIANQLTIEATVSSNKFDNKNSNNSDSIVISVGDIDGNKPLYLHSDLTLDRFADTTNSSVLLRDRGTLVYQITPSLQQNISLNYDQDIPLEILMSRENGRDGNQDFRATLRVNRNGNLTTIAEFDGGGNISGNITFYGVPLSVINPIELLIGDILELVLFTNDGSAFRNVGINIFSSSNNNVSSIKLTSKTLINVESVSVWDAPYPNGNELDAITVDSTVYLRSSVSDPFGFEDISDVRVTIQDDAGNIFANNESLTRVEGNNDRGVFEYEFNSPNIDNANEFFISIVADEGFENLVKDEISKTFTIKGLPALNFTKSQITTFDPINGTNNPKAIPNSIVQYNLTITNDGEGEVDTDSLVIIDQLANNTSLFVNDLQNGSPIFLTDGNPSSNLTLSFSSLSSTTDDIDFSNNNGGDFNYVPEPDGDGYDPLITDIRLMPKGTMPGISSGSPQFILTYQVKVQ